MIAPARKDSVALGDTVWLQIRAEMDLYSNFYYPDILNRIFPDILRIVTSLNCFKNIILSAMNVLVLQN